MKRSLSSSIATAMVAIQLATTQPTPAGAFVSRSPSWTSGLRIHPTFPDAAAAVAASSAARISSPSPRSDSTTTTSLYSIADTLGNFQLDDLVYRAESVANSLATLSLQDPSNLLTSLPILYGAGLLTSFSPCVWGLLPLTMSYISSAAGDRRDGQTLLPTAAFAAGLAVVFCSLGVAAVELGGVFGSNNNAVVAIASNVICLAMGLRLLELVQLPLPSLDLAKATASSSNDAAGPVLLDGTGQVLSSSSNSNKSNSDERGSLLRTFLLGGSSALVASPCATPVLTSILAFVANGPSHNPGLGALLLLGYTLGYSTPLLIVAGTGGQALVDLRKSGKNSENGGWYSSVAPWVTPLTGGILLWYGTNGVLTAVFGDPSLAGLAILE